MEREKEGERHEESEEKRVSTNHEWHTCATLGKRSDNSDSLVMECYNNSIGE